MAGLVDCEKLYPYGYQGPWRRVAKLIAPSSISSGLYDPKELPTSWNKHVPVPHLRDRWPAPNQGDTWGNINARSSTATGPDPDSYDVGRIEPSSTLKVPVPLPRAPGSLFVELAEASGAPSGPAAPEGPKDILDIANVILKTTANPADKYWWASRVNTLTRLRMIAIERPSGLDKEDLELEKQLSDAMKAKAMDLTNPEHKVVFVAPPAPLSSADVETAMSNALTGVFATARSRKRVDDPDEVKVHIPPSGPIIEQN